LIDDAGDTPEEVIEPVEKSMDDTIRDTLAEIEARDAPEEVVEPASRNRDEAGKFAKAEEAIEPVTPAEEVADEPAAPVVVPPEVQRLGLRKDEAEAFAQASDAVKAAFIRRSEEMHKGIEQFRGNAQFGQTMQSVIQPHMQTLQNLGISPDKAISELLGADQKLRYGTPQQKQAYFAELGKAYGIDVSSLPEPQPMDPNVQSLQQQVQQLSGWIQQQTLVGQQQEQAALNSEISRFSADPSHKHFESVRGQMAALLQAQQATTLDEAYDMAVYANPQTRTAVLAEQQAASEAARRVSVAAKTQEAKRAASVNLTRRGSMPSKQPVGTMEETIRATADRLGML